MPNSHFLFTKFDTQRMQAPWATIVLTANFSAATCKAVAKCRDWTQIWWSDWGTNIKIEHLQEQLADFNHVQYRMLPANSSRGDDVVQMSNSKKLSMSATDQINQQAVASYLHEADWPGNKVLPKSWSKWKDDKNSLCQWYYKRLHYLWGWMESHTGKQC